jgi:hypothetical protein
LYIYISHTGVTNIEPKNRDKDHGIKPYSDGSMEENVYIKYIVVKQGSGPYGPFDLRYFLFRENLLPAIQFPLFEWRDGDDTVGYLSRTLQAHVNDDWIGGGDGYVDLGGWIWVKSPRHQLVAGLLGYKIEILGTQSGSGSGTESDHYWEGSCAYLNESYSVAVDSNTASGITTVEFDITEVLQSEWTDEIVYTYAGERGDTRIEVTC